MRGSGERGGICFKCLPAPATVFLCSFEQDALWFLWPYLSGPRGSISTVAEWSFVKDESPQVRSFIVGTVGARESPLPPNSQWVRHLSSEEAQLRLPYLRSLLSRRPAEGGYGLTPGHFNAALQEVSAMMCAFAALRLC